MNPQPPQSVKFRPTMLLDPVKNEGTIKTGELYTGELIANRIYFTDTNNTEWVFYIGITCTLEQ